MIAAPETFSADLILQRAIRGNDDDCQDAPKCTARGEGLVGPDRIETRSLILSAHTVENAEDAYRVESNPKVMQFLGGEYGRPKEQFLRDFPQQHVGRFPEYLAVRRKGDLVYLGNCSLRECRLYELGSAASLSAIQPRIVIDEPHWRHMYGVEVLRALLSHAFGPMDAKLVAGVIDSRHPRMRQLCALYGFRQHQRHTLESSGQHESGELWGVTREEFATALCRRLKQAEATES
jgi:RimJ/RimL family protein N-acetyltransferase